MIKQLIEKITSTNAPICVGLDPMLSYIPEHVKEKAFEAYGETLAKEPAANVEYVEIVDSQTLLPVDNLNGPILVAIAVRIGKTRLIDNFTLPE